MTKQHHHTRVARRAGFTMLELTVAAALLGTVFVITLPLLKHVRTSRDAAQQQFIAQQEAANIMERLAVDPSSQAMDETMTFSSEAADHLQDADVTITRDPAEDGLQQLTVTVGWTNEVGERPTPVTLTAWFPSEESMP